MRIHSRAEWGAAAPRGHIADIGGKRPDVIVHTFAGSSTGTVPMSFDRAASIMRGVQRSHFARGFDDFGYSFGVDPEGRVFEGRGWRRRGAHTQHGGNYTGHGIGHFGHGDVQRFTDAQWASTRALILEGIRLGHISPVYRITGHRDWLKRYEYKSCPGDLVYGDIHRLDAGTAFMRDGTAGGEDVDLVGVRGLRKGAKGAEVEELQRLLNAHGGTLVVDGDFGPATEGTLRNFQLHVGAPPSLIADPGTMCLLRPRTTVVEGLDPARVRRELEGFRAHFTAAGRDAKSSALSAQTGLETVQRVLDELG